MSTRRVTQPSPADNGRVPEPGDAHEPEQPGGLDFEPSSFEEPAAQPVAQPATSAPDPFDPSTYRVSQTLAAAAGVKKVLTDLAAIPPNKAWWVRRHPAPEYTLDTFVIELKEEKETYLVLPPLWPALVAEATFHRKTFHLAVTMQGKPFLWPVRRPADDTREPDRWMKAPLEAIRLAADKWTRISWNVATQQHDVVTCESTATPEWPDLPFRELLKLAFKNFVIDHRDHPVLKRLRGDMK